MQYNRWTGFPSTDPYFEFFAEFNSDNDLNRLTGTAVSSGTAAVIDTVKGGRLRLSGAATTDSSGYEVQVSALSNNLERNGTLHFRTTVQLGESTSSNVATKSAFLAGYAVTDTSLIASAPTDGIYFRKSKDSTSLDAVLRVGGADIATSTSLATIVSSTEYTLSIEVLMDDIDRAGRARFYVNGLLRAEFVSSAFMANTVLMAPSLAFQTGDNTGTKYALFEDLGSLQSR